MLKNSNILLHLNFIYIKLIFGTKIQISDYWIKVGILP